MDYGRTGRQHFKNWIFSSCSCSFCVLVEPCFYPLLVRADYEEDKDGESPSPFGSHILHFYFPSAKQLILCCLPAFPAPDFFLGPTRISYVRPIKARGRADWTDLREGRGRLFQTFLWLTNVAMGFLVIGQKLPLVLKFSLELWSSSFNFPT